MGEQEWSGPEVPGADAPGNDVPKAEPPGSAGGPLIDRPAVPASAHRFEYGKDGPRSILVGVDGTETSVNAFIYAAGVARRQCADLQVVYVWPYQGSALDLAGYSASALQQAAEETLEEVRVLATQAHQELGIAITIEVRHGEPSQQLLEAAKAVRADQIVIGASSKMAHRFIGSVGVKMFRRGHTPITVVP